MTQSAKLRQDDRVEMVVDIYESADIIASQDHNTDPVYANTKETLQTQNTDAAQDQKPGHKRLTVLCLALLCVLLVVATTALSIKFYQLTTERDQLQRNYDSIVAKREQNISHVATQLGWTYNGSSFYNMSNIQDTWEQGRNDCIKKGADLVIINSQDEQEFVDKLRRGQEAWIGLTDRVTEGTWKWVDGSTLTTKFWFMGEPNNYKNYEDCALTGYNSDSIFNWADFSCNQKKAFWICEKKML